MAYSLHKVRLLVCFTLVFIIFWWICFCPFFFNCSCLEVFKKNHRDQIMVVGTGIGNFDPSKDPAKYNLVDPIERNTVGVPTGGWTAIHFRADNPGGWFMHCHFELHTGWGLKTAFVMEDGPEQDQNVLPPPKNLPAC